MPLLVLPRAVATRGQLLLADQGGIVLFYAGICAQFRLPPGHPRQPDANSRLGSSGAGCSQAETGRREPVAPFFRYGRALLRFANETRVKSRAGESDIRRWPPVLHHPFVRAGAMAFVRCSRRAKFRLVEVALA